MMAKFWFNPTYDVAVQLCHQHAMQVAIRKGAEPGGNIGFWHRIAELGAEFSYGGGIGCGGGSNGDQEASKTDCAHSK